jgi:hypothetical protein
MRYRVPRESSVISSEFALSIAFSMSFRSTRRQASHLQHERKDNRPVNNLLPDLLNPRHSLAVSGLDPERCALCSLGDLILRLRPQDKPATHAPKRSKSRPDLLLEVLSRSRSCSCKRRSTPGAVLGQGNTSGSSMMLSQRS